MQMARSKNAVKRIGILTAGSDCPGLNAAIRAIGKAAQGSHGAEVITFQDGFQGLVEDEICPMPLSGILTAGGTILGTSRETLQDASGPEDKTDAAVATYQRHNLDVLVCIGGRETQESAYRLAQKGINVITLPKGIDNDLAMTDTTIGFDTAMSTATEAIDRLHSTAHSHHRIIIVEIMGRNTGWLTLGSGIAGGADVIIIPEIPYDVNKVAEAILERNRSGRRFSIVAVSEGGISRDTVEFFEHSKHVNRLTREGEERTQVEDQLEKIENRLTGNTIYLANRLEKFTGLVTRITILGHLLRGGTPTAADRVLATNLGTACLRIINEGSFGVMIAIRNGDIQTVPLDQVIGKHKQIPLTHTWIQSARKVGTCLGD
jgi:ATP-dependent phosphofructokinase / diphosphate-dependent phosphofructokinase